MTNNELPNNRIRNGFLDDRLNAQKFYDEKLQRAKELIHQILAVTYGYDDVIETNNDWGHGNFLEILEMFQINHKNFSRSDFAEDLQTVIFQYSMSHDKGHREWREKIFTERGLDDDGEPLAKEECQEAEKETPNILDLSAQPENLNINSEKELAELLSKVMTHPNLSDELQIIIGNGITDTGGQSESLNEFNNSPKVIYEYLFGGEYED